MHSFYTLAQEPSITISAFDLVVIPILFFGCYLFVKLFFKKNAENSPHLRYLLPALYTKMIFAIIFCLVYIFYYAGDTHAYYRNISVLMNLFYENPTGYFKILLWGPKEEFFYFFSHRTGYPYYYMWSDPNTFAVSRIISVFSIFTKSYLVSSLLTSIFAFTGIWKLYMVFYKRYPHLHKEFAFAILFVPSVLFWGSGIIKESLLMMSVGWFIWSFDRIITKNSSFSSVIFLLVSGNLLLLVKPYVFITILGTVFIWVSYEQTLKIKNKIIRRIMLPVMFIVASLGYVLFYANMGSDLGKYGSVESIIDKAKVTQEDLVRAEQYGKNSFFIGQISSSPFELIKLAPKAIIAGLYRPYIWEARNAFMLFSSIENLVFLIFTIFVFFRRSFWKIIYLIGKDPFLLSILFFVIFFAYGVGLSTSNFGALVRYKIPLIPFLLSALFITRNYYNIHLRKQVLYDKNFMTFKTK